MREGRDVLLVTTGIMLQHSMKAADALAGHGISVGVLYFPTVKPFDTAALLAAARGVPLVAAVEEHTEIGGLGAAVAEALLEAACAPAAGMLRLAIPDVFATKYGSQELLLAHFGIDADGIVRRVSERIGIHAKKKIA